MHIIFRRKIRDLSPAILIYSFSVVRKYLIPVFPHAFLSALCGSESRKEYESIMDYNPAEYSNDKKELPALRHSGRV